MNRFDDQHVDETSWAWRSLIGQPPLLKWTPTGNNVTLTINEQAYYIDMGNYIIAWFNVTWPATADGNAAQILGLPKSAKTGSGVTIGFSNDAVAICMSLSSFITVPTIAVRALVGGAVRTNANCSTFQYVGSITYRV